MKRTTRLAWALWVAFLILGVVALTSVAFDPRIAANAVSQLLPLLAFATVGAIIIWRRPRNRIGWLFLGVALLVASTHAGLAYSEYALSIDTRFPGGAVAAWIASWSASVGFLMLFTLLLLLFPTGDLPSRRWRPLLRLIAVALLTTALARMFREGPLLSPFDEEALRDGTLNPFGIAGLEGVSDVARAVERAFGLFVVVLAGISVLSRYRSAGFAERQQLKWFGFAALSLVGVLVVGNSLPLVFGASPYMVLWWSLVFPAALALVPISAGLAILRYRLYDIDVLINRTLVYGALTTTLAVTYVATVVLLQAILRPLTSGSELAVAGSTLATLALVQPLRRRIQQGVDRRFYRSRYDAASTLDALSARLRDEVHLDAVRADVLDAVGRTLQPAHAGLWLTGTPRNDLRTPRE